MGVHADAAHLLSSFGAFDMSRIAVCQIISSTGSFQKGDDYGLFLKGSKSVNIAFAKCCCKTLSLPWLPWMLADCFFGILNKKTAAVCIKKTYLVSQNPLSCVHISFPIPALNPCTNPIRPLVLFDQWFPTATLSPRIRK